MNRYHKGSPITREVVEETVGLAVAATVANDFSGLSRAVNRGVLLWEEAPPVGRGARHRGARGVHRARPAGSRRRSASLFREALLPEGGPSWA